MKLHLPKTLLAAVLACFAVEASYGLSISSRAAWNVNTIVGEIPTGGSVTKTWNGRTYTFTISSNGMLNVSGYEVNIDDSVISLSGITFEVDRNSLKDFSGASPASLILIKFSSYTWGVNVKGKAEGASSALFTGEANGNHDWGDAGRPAVTNMAESSPGSGKSIVSAYFNTDVTPGTALANGYASKTTENDCFYYAGGLRYSSASGTPSIQFNTTYVTNLIQQADSYQSGASSYSVGNADGTWTYRNGEYIHMATAVSDTGVDATLVADGRLQVSGSNVDKLKANGGDIIIGGSGQLYLNPSANIELSNAIYLGGSTYDDAATHGALYFGSAITLNGAITLIEDSTMGAEAGNVSINGNVSGAYKLSIVQGTGVDFAGGMELGALELASGVSIDIKDNAATVGTFSNTGDGAQTTVTVTSTTLTINGLYAGSSNVLTTGAGGEIIFGPNASIDISKLTAEGGSGFTVDGFIHESYRVTASEVNASLSGGAGATIALVRGEASLGSGTWSDGLVSMAGTVYNIVGTKSYDDYLSEAAAVGKTATSILVQASGTFVATNIDQTIAMTSAGGGTLSAGWNGRAQASDAISAAAKSFSGHVVVESGASWLIGEGYSFSSVTVESGGQFGLAGAYTGDIAITGTGTAAGGDQQGALKFGDGVTLTGNVTIFGNKAALSTAGFDAGTIQGNINCDTEGGAELEILNSQSGTSVTTNTITVTGNLSGINRVTTAAASMTVTGTIESFGDTFTKSGAGTLTLSKLGAITSGNVVVEGGILDLTGGGEAGTLSGVDVEVKAGATIKVGHDCAGWNGGIRSITLLGEAGQVATMINNDTTGNGNTWNTVLNLKGHATVSGGNLLSLGGSLSAEGTGNTFTSKLLIAKDFTVTVAEGGELELSGQIVNSEHGQKEMTAKLIKEGAGVLTLTNANNTFERGGIVLNAGTLKLQGASVEPGAGTLDMAKDTIFEVAAGENGSTTLSNSITGSGHLTVSSGTLTLNGANAVSLENINVSVGANMVIDSAKTVNVMGTIYSDGVLTVNGEIIMENADQLAGENFSEGENGLYTGGTVYVVQGSDVSSKTDRLGGNGRITIGTDTFDLSSIDGAEENVEANNFTWNHTTGVLTYNDKKVDGDTQHDTTAYYVNVGTVIYGQGDTTTSETLILNGGTLQVTSTTALNKSVKALSASTLHIDKDAEVNRSSISEGRQHVYLTGKGTYTISGSDAPALEVNLGGDWQGWVKLQDVAANALDLNAYGPQLELSGLFRNPVSGGTAQGYLKTGTTTFTSNIRLTAADNVAALYLRNGNDYDTYIFSGKISGGGDIVRDEQAGTHKTLKFTGDVSEWAGKFTSSHSGGSNFVTTLEFHDGAKTIKTGVEATTDTIVNVTIDNNQTVNFGDSQDAERGKIAINKSAGGTLTTSGDGAKNFLGSVAAKTLVTSGGKASFKQGATFGTTRLENLNEQSSGTAKNVTIDGGHLTGAGEDVQTLGELASLDVTFAASAAVDVSNVVMQDVTLRNGAVTYRNVTAVAATAGGEAVAAPVLYAATASDTPATLTAMEVQVGGTASGTLTIDVTQELISSHVGETLEWTIFSGVSLANGESLTLNLGDVLRSIVDNGQPKVTLSGDWVDNAGQPLVLTSANLGSLSTGNLLVAPVAGGNLVLTVENMPEPTTGTLSVLALAALAVRRRRK